MQIAIVGAGIAGLYLAWKLAEKGHQVTIFEKKEKIGKKVCSGLFSERILEFIPPSQKLIQNQIESVLIHWVAGGWRSGKTIKVRFSRKLLVMSHFELDNLVAELAATSGAKIILNHNVVDESKDSSPPFTNARVGDETKVSSSPFARLRLARVVEQDFVAFQRKFDRIIGCDGPNSTVRKLSGLSEPDYRLAIRGFLLKNDSSGFVETWSQKQGFIWRIPRGKEVEYGIISNPKEAKLLLDDFLQKNNLKLEGLESAVVPQGFLIPVNSKVTLCGDAAGLTKPWSGGGVIWGLTAAEILLKNFPNFLKYQKEMKKTFLPKIIFSKIATKIVYFLGFNFPWILPKNVKIESDFLI